MNTPQDILNYVLSNGKEAEFLQRIMMQKQQFSIAEITDAEMLYADGKCILTSEMYSLHLQVEDDDILTAACNGLYISAFISRYKEQYQVEFLVHRYPRHMKPQFEENILQEVIRYMILKTIITLRLNTWRKVDEYLQ